MKITVTVAAHVGIPGYVPNASQEIDLTPDSAPDAIAVAAEQAWTELKAGLAADRALLTVTD